MLPKTPPKLKIFINIENGSLKNLLEERGEQINMYDPWVDDYEFKLTKQCYFIGTNHDMFIEYEFPKGSIVLDPWGIIEDQDDVKVIRIGR